MAAKIKTVEEKSREDKKKVEDLVAEHECFKRRTEDTKLLVEKVDTLEKETRVIVQAHKRITTKTDGLEDVVKDKVKMLFKDNWKETNLLVETVVSEVNKAKGDLQELLQEVHEAIQNNEDLQNEMQKMESC